jgi:hypothetical protein
MKRRWNFAERGPEMTSSSSRFGKTHLDLIPPGLGVSNSANLSLQNPATLHEWDHNPNWSKDFCKNMSEIICLPDFKRDIWFLRYTLLKAVHFRVGENAEARGVPRLFEYRNPLAQAVIKRVTQKLISELKEILGDRYEEKDSEFVENSVDSILFEEFSNLKPENYAFVEEYLEDVVKKGEGVTPLNDSCCLRTCDLRNIQRAWDLYVKEKRRDLHGMKQYRKWFTQDNSKTGYLPNHESRKEPFYLYKKEWILSQRREEQWNDFVDWTSELERKHLLRNYEKLHRLAAEDVDQSVSEGNDVGSENEALNYEHAMEELLQEAGTSIARQDVPANDTACGIRRRILEFEQSLEAMAAME